MNLGTNFMQINTKMYTENHASAYNAYLRVLVYIKGAIHATYGVDKNILIITATSLMYTYIYITNNCVNT